jgi:hypothetical protein
MVDIHFVVRKTELLRESRVRQPTIRALLIVVRRELVRSVALEMCKTGQFTSDKNASKISTFVLNVFDTNFLNGDAMNLRATRLKIEGRSENGFSQLSLHFNLNKRDS